MPRYPRLPDGAPLPEHAPPARARARVRRQRFRGRCRFRCRTRAAVVYYALFADDATTEEFTAVCAAAGTTLFAGVMAGLALASCERLIAAGDVGPAQDPPTRFRAVLRDTPKRAAVVVCARLVRVAVPIRPRHRRGRPRSRRWRWRAPRSCGGDGSALRCRYCGSTSSSVPTESPQFAISYLDTRLVPGAETTTPVGRASCAATATPTRRCTCGSTAPRRACGCPRVTRAPSTRDVRGLCAAFAKVIEDVVTRH